MNKPDRSEPPPSGLPIVLLAITLLIVAAICSYYQIPLSKDNFGG